jgi:hypothetical protein
LAKLLYHKWNQGHHTGFFDGVGQSSLMERASAVFFGRIDFSLGIHKAAQKVGVFEVDLVHFGFAKMADFFFDSYRLAIIVLIVIGHKNI